MSDLELKTIVPKTERRYLTESRRPATATPAIEDPKQRGLMLGSLCLLLLALGIVLWHDRDFWFPDTAETESEQAAETAPSPAANHVAEQSPAAVARVAPPAKRSHQAARRRIAPALAPAPPVAVATTTRTVLPPLEVEVVAGDIHSTVRPGSNSVRVDLQPGTPPQPVTDAGISGESPTAASVTNNASEQVQMSPDASAIVTRPVKPAYPMLARQMKVQGSVILRALIGRDGIIQNLHVVSGPHILASAAEDAVRQWHFKPHFQGSEAVETQAKITVNFTISTN
jgi:protein TonB